MANPRILILVFLTLAQLKTKAQLCSGSLGDPVAWIRFGEGNGAGPALPPSVTNYTFSVSSCPNDGSYTITNLSFGCFNSSWHTLVGDHTPDDAGGKYMLVNASNDPGVFFVDTIRGLCGGTTYEFSAYVMNVLKLGECNGNGRDPNLTFSIESLGGTVLTTRNSGDIPETEDPTWVQYGTFFQTPSNVSSVVVRITNNAPGGCGNDLALDDISFRPCGPALNVYLASNNLQTINLCDGDAKSLLISASYSNTYANPRLQWQESLDNGRSWNDLPGATQSSYQRPPSSVGNFQYRLLIGDGANINNPSCRIASKPIYININPPPFVQATNYVNGCLGSDLALFASGGSVYEWAGPNNFYSKEQGPVLKNLRYIDSGLYTVRVTTVFGCSNSATTRIKVFPNVVLSTGPDVSFCEGDSVQLQASGGTGYLWEPREGLSSPFIPNPVARPKDSTRYKVTVVNNGGCFASKDVQVNVWKRPQAYAGRDLKTLKERPVTLLGSASGTDLRYSWTPAQNMSLANTLRPVVTPPATNYPQVFPYRLEVTSNLGCGTSTDDMTVTVYETVRIPNTFTPNGDGYNDFWEIELLPEFTQAVLEVYNTAGTLVYRSIGYNKPWDGKYKGSYLPAGTYYYVVDLKVLNASKLSGYVTIIR
jgi:gliding motility-associated-like protein